MKKIAGATVWMTGSSLGTLTLGFLTQVYLASRFGARLEMDAYIAATTLPMVVVTVLIASLGVVFIPIFVEYENAQNPEEAWRITSSVLNFSVMGLSVIAAAGWLLSRPLLQATAPGFSPAALELSVHLLRCLWPTVVLSGLFSLLTGIYQAEHRFQTTAIAPFVGAMLLFGFAILFIPWWGIQGVAIASLASNLIQVLWLLPILLAPGHYRLVFDYRHPAVRSLVGLLVPLVLGSMLYRATPLLDQFVASSLPTGSIAYLGYGNRILMVLNTVLVSGLSTTLFPAMAREAAAEDFSRLRHTIAQGQRVLMLLMFPMIAILWALREPFVEVAFQRGQFMAADTQAVAALLPWYLLALIGGGLGTLVGRAYYALKDTRTAAMIGVLEVGAYVLYMPVLAHRYGAMGMAMATAIYLNTALLGNGLIIFYKLGAVGGLNLLKAAIRLILIAALAGVVAYGVSHWLGWPPIGTLVIGSLVGAGFYGGILYLFRAPELVALGAHLESSRIGGSLGWLLKPLAGDRRSSIA